MKFKNRIRILSLLLAVLLLCGCSIQESDWMFLQGQTGQNVDDGMISGTRAGIARQGISGQFKSFDCTDEMSYFLLSLPSGAMLYCLEHDEQTLKPLCPITGCSHVDSTCGAWFGSNGNVCVYDGLVYVNAGPRLYQMNPDGSDQTLILDLTQYAQEPYNGFAEPKLWNGVFTYYLTWYAQAWDEENGEAYTGQLGFSGYEPYYFRLDGTMDQPEKMARLETEGLSDLNLITQYNDGDQFIMRSSEGSKSGGFHQLYTWDPQENRIRWYADVSDVVGKQYKPFGLGGTSEYSGVLTTLREYEAFDQGYWGTECGFYLEREYGTYRIEDNLVCKWDYATGTGQPLLKTGLTGAYRLSCFPDCFVLIKTYEQQGQITDPPVLYLYDWNTDLLGVCYLDYEMGVLPQDVICGETGNRIYLAGHFTGIPEYYIDKQDLKGGEVIPKSLEYENLDPEALYSNTFGLIEAFREEQATLQAQMEAQFQNP